MNEQANERESEQPAGEISGAAGVNAGLGSFNHLTTDGADAAPDEAKDDNPAPAALTPPLTHGCWDCGRLWSDPGWVDAWIPAEHWEQIAPIKGVGTEGSGHLCVHCITKALSAVGATDVPVTLWAAPFRTGEVVPPRRRAPELPTEMARPSLA